MMKKILAKLLLIYWFSGADWGLDQDLIFRRMTVDLRPKFLLLCSALWTNYIKEEGFARREGWVNRNKLLLMDQSQERSMMSERWYHSCKYESFFDKVTTMCGVNETPDNEALVSSFVCIIFPTFSTIKRVTKATPNTQPINPSQKRLQGCMSLSSRWVTLAILIGNGSIDKMLLIILQRLSLF